MSDDGARLIFRAMMVVWAVLALGSFRFTSQDGAGFVAAGMQVVRGEVAVVYAGPADRFAITDDRTKQLICEGDDADTRCESYARYLSTPAALPLVVPFGLGSLQLGIFLWRIPIVASLIWGMVLLRERAAEARHGPVLLAASAVALTPAVHFLVVMGQTSSSMFLAVALGVSGAAAGGVRRAGAVVTGTVAITTKIVPALTLVPLYLLGARKAAVATVVAVVALAAAATAIGGVDIWHEYLQLSTAIADSTEGTELSARLTRWLPWPVLGALLVAFAAALVHRRRALSADLLYAAAWVGAVSLTPFLWNHYLWACFAALVIVYAEHRTRPALVATAAYVAGEAILHLQGSPEGSSLWRALVVAVTAGVILHAAYAPEVTRSATRDLPSTGP